MTVDTNVGLFDTQDNPWVPKSLDREADWERCSTPRSAESPMPTSDVIREDNGKERTF